VLRDVARTQGWRDRIEAAAPTRTRIGDSWVYSWPSP
jgi:hypothetical protein